MTSSFSSAFGLAVAGAVFGLGAGSSASAASFDCASATRQMEKLICSDARLSEADEQMAQAYEAKRKALSPAGRQILKEGQRSWLRMVDAACRDPGDPADAMTELACVVERYQDRIETLRADWQAGPFRLVFVERYEAFYIKGDDPGIEGQLVYHEVEYPQIDSPRSLLSLTPKNYLICLSA